MGTILCEMGLVLACGLLLFSVYEFSIMGTSGKRWELVAGIAVIAALAVTFAILPMPVAIALSGLTRSVSEGAGVAPQETCGIPR
ncbi:MAG: hypothetical protein ACHRXM_19000 [Isosphaerales bacterium]